MNGKLFTPLLSTLFLIIPVVMSAQGVFDSTTFAPLVGIPGVDNGANDFGEYVNSLYALAIGIAGMLAVIKLVLAGTKYMLSDIVTSKEDAKKDIKGALVGLLIVLSAVLILTTINTDLTEVDISLDGVNGDSTDYLSRDLERIQGIEQACDADPGCIIITGGSETACTASNGRFINGSILQRALGGNLLNTCIITSAEFCENPNLERICDGSDCRCVDTTFETVTNPGDSFETRIETLSENYEIVSSGHSEPFPAGDTAALEAAANACIREQRGGTYYELFTDPADASQVFLYCLSER